MAVPLVTFDAGLKHFYLFCCRMLITTTLRFWGIFWVDASSVENAERAMCEIGKIGGVDETFMAGMYWLANLQEP